MHASFFHDTPGRQKFAKCAALAVASISSLPALHPQTCTSNPTASASSAVARTQ